MELTSHYRSRSQGGGPFFVCIYAYPSTQTGVCGYGHEKETTPLPGARGDRQCCRSCPFGCQTRSGGTYELSAFCYTPRWREGSRLTSAVTSLTRHKNVRQYLSKQKLS